MHTEGRPCPPSRLALASGSRAIVDRQWQGQEGRKGPLKYPFLPNTCLVEEIRILQNLNHSVANSIAEMALQARDLSNRVRSRGTGPWALSAAEPCASSARSLSVGRHAPETGQGAHSQKPAPLLSMQHVSPSPKPSLERVIP